MSDGDNEDSEGNQSEELDHSIILENTINVVEVEEEDHVKSEMVESILISNVASSCLIRLKPEEVKNDLVNKLENIGSKVLTFKHKKDQYGDFKTGLAKISPVNLQLIWGRRLKVEHCSIIHYNPTF